jgi:Zn-dependent peptidase ImmA (M78 family)
LNDDPEKIADVVRRNFNLTVEDQFKWKNPSEGYNILRELIESNNIRVFQFKADINELRGFTLLDSKPYVINVNSKDIFEARIFTLLHEYGHVILNIPALCTPYTPISTDTHGVKVERWCNNFAGAFLMPKANLTDDFDNYHGLSNYRKMAKKYRVSYAATLTRLVSLDKISSKVYYYHMDILKKEEEDEEKVKAKLKEEAKEDDKTGGFGEKATDRVRREMGKEYISLVLKNTKNGLITYSRALDYLNIKTDHLRDLFNQ